MCRYWKYCNGPISNVNVRVLCFSQYYSVALSTPQEIIPIFCRKFIMYLTLWTALCGRCKPGPIYYNRVTGIRASECSRTTQFVRQSSHGHRANHTHLQQPVDAGALSRLRSTPCERGAVDAAGSFFGNFFAKHKAALKNHVKQALHAHGVQGGHRILHLLYP